MGRLERCPTVSNGFLGDSGGIFAVTTFIQLDATFAVRSAVRSKHPEVANMHPKLFNSATPVKA